MDDNLESVGFWELALFSDRNNLSEALLFLRKANFDQKKVYRFKQYLIITVNIISFLVVILVLVSINLHLEKEALKKFLVLT